jgi:hypothetical protein
MWAANRVYDLLECDSSAADAPHRTLAIAYCSEAPQVTISKTAGMIAEKDGPIGWITFNNPERRNAVFMDM